MVMYCLWLHFSRIGLSENMHAKCADFGLSRAFDNNADSHISMRPAGTFGYADPDIKSIDQVGGTASLVCSLQTCCGD
ncbi:putative LRR receptor serine/threonine-protein kinase [Trifolium repens]|nr:putative LRR receptor serine/threonine-protein kinase [Trifolium repens]